MPYIYLVMLWGTIIPPAAAFRIKLGDELLFSNLGYTSTIIGFYIFPILFLTISRTTIYLSLSLFPLIICCSLKG